MNNLMNNNQITEIDNILAAMTPDQLASLQDRARDLRLSITEKTVTALSGRMARTENNVDYLTKMQKKQEELNLEYEKNITSLASPNYKRFYTKFKSKASKRVRELLGSSVTPQYVLFAPYLHKRIYVDIAKKLELPSWDHISMKNYDCNESQYQIAKDIRDTWRPTKSYMDYCIHQLSEKRDAGILAAEKCRALTQFLAATNNGKDIPFAR